MPPLAPSHDVRAEPGPPPVIRWLPEAAVAGVLGISATALTGWVGGADRLTRGLSGSVAMNPMTAVCHLMMATALWRWRRPEDAAAMRVARGAAALAGAFGLLRVASYAVGLDLGLDRLLFADSLGVDPGGNAVAPNTAANFALLGAAFFLLDAAAPRRRALGQAAVAAAGLTAFVAFVGHVLGAPSLYRPFPAIGMAVNTALCFIMLCLGILAARPRWGVAAILASPHSGGVLARRVVPVAVLLPIVIGFVRLWAERQGVISMAFGVGIMTLTSVIPLTALLLRTAAELNRVDRQRLAAFEQEMRAGRLEAANQELEAFSYSVSHDLRAPLRHIDGFIELLNKHAAAGLDETSRRYLAVIMDSCRRMGTLIDELLAFSRMARAEMRAAPVALGSLVEQVRAELYCDEKGRRVDWRVAPLPEVKGDGTMLRLVFQNLIGNALKFTRTREEAVIEIGMTRPRGGRPALFVRDNGVGFDMKYKDKLFGVFQRLHRQDEFEGTGIGLANVRRIVQRHGGEVWAESELGKGAAFYIALPAFEEARA